MVEIIVEVEKLEDLIKVSLANRKQYIPPVGLFGHFFFRDKHFYIVIDDPVLPEEDFTVLVYKSDKKPEGNFIKYTIRTGGGKTYFTNTFNGTDPVIPIVELADETVLKKEFCSKEDLIKLKLRTLKDIARSLYGIDPVLARNVSPLFCTKKNASYSYFVRILLAQGEITKVIILFSEATFLTRSSILKYEVHPREELVEVNDLSEARDPRSLFLPVVKIRKGLNLHEL